MPLQYAFNFDIRPTLRLRLVEEIITKQRIINPAPCRKTLVALIEEGKIDGFKSDVGWVVYEDSFNLWVMGIQNHGHT